MIFDNILDDNLSLNDACNEYYDYIFDFCLNSLYFNEQIACDVTQDTFTELCLQWEIMKKDNVRGWLRVTASNKIKQTKAKYAKTKNHVDIDNYLSVEKEIIEYEDIDVIIKNDIINRNIDEYKNKVYEKLSDDEIKISEYLQEGLTQLQISERMGIKYEATRARVVRLRNKVNQILDEVVNTLIMLVIFIALFFIQ